MQITNIYYIHRAALILLIMIFENIACRYAIVRKKTAVATEQSQCVFTEMKKYELEFVAMFQLQYPGGK